MKNVTVNFNKREKNLEKKMRDKQKFSNKQTRKHNSPKYMSMMFQALCVMEENENVK